MTKLSVLLASISIAATTIPAARAEESGLVCALVPVLTESFLKTHVAIKNASNEVYEHTADQMIKRIDPSKVILLQSDVDELRPKVLKFLKTMKTSPDCSDLEAIKPLLVKRAKDQLAYAKEALGPKYKLDESVELVLDPEKREFAKNEEEAKKRQLVQIHFQISNYLMTDMKLPKAKEQLIHRYELTVKRMEEMKNSDIYDYTVNAFAAALDPHSNYMSPEATEDFQINMRLSLEGIGASLSNEDGYTVIQELIPGGAASKSNQLLPKDKIIAVGQGKSGASENVIDMDLKDVVRRIRGKAGTSVRLTILREKPEVQRLNVTLVRSKVQLEDDAAKVEMTERVVNGKKMKLARIELPGFYGGQKRTDRTSYKDVAAAVEKANKAGAEGILFDLSMNSGGLLDEAVRIGGLFLNRGNIVATKDSEGEVQMLDDIDSRVQFNGPMVVLISRLSASASEIVAGALQDYKRAVIVGGDHTYGKGSVQAVLPLQNDFGIIKVTTGLFFIPGGNSTQHRGVTSDVAFPSPFSTSDIGEKFLDYSLKPDSIRPFLSPEANEDNQWTPVSKAEIEKLRLLSADRVSKSKDFAEITKELKETEEKKGVIKLADMRKKEGESKKKNKDKAPKLVAKERNKPQIDEAFNILADFVNMRKMGSHKLVTQQQGAKDEKKD
jgi:carboxyl-terminal processing protease